MDILVKKIFELLQKRKQTLSFAESCTGGLVSAQFTDLAGVSEVFLGAIVSYGNEVKSSILGVSENELKTHGAVSREVAIKMAQGVREKLKSTWSVSITGIAGPGGGSPDKPVGTVWFAVVGPSIEEAKMCSFKGNRQTVRASSVEFALEFLLDKLTNNES